MKIYADTKVSAVAKTIIGRGSDFDIIVDEGNIKEFQSALDSDSDNTLELKIGHCIKSDEHGRTHVLSNGAFGCGLRGTNVLATIA